MKLISFLTLVLLISSCMEAHQGSRNKNPDGGRGNGGNDGPNIDPVLATDLPDFLRSQSYRNKTIKPRTYSQELKAVIANNADTSFRAIPRDIDTDNSVTYAIAPQAECGIGEKLNTLKSKIDDCAKKNDGMAAWYGKLYGISGEGDWRLVAKNAHFVIFQDTTTSLLWSSTVESGTWAQASGNVDRDKDYTCSTINLDIFDEEEVSWRLPTRNEFLQADINGARYALPDTENKFWTASANGDDLTQAWAIEQSTGVLSKVGKSQELAIRCIGYPLK